jgi:two-component system sensor histidine kinase UhpB
VIQAQQALSRSLAGQLEDERRRIAGDLHDSLNALLIRIRLDAQGIARATVDRPADLPAIRGRAGDISDHVATLYAQCSALMQKLRPEAIDLVGLHETLSDMIHRYNRAHPSCAFALAVDGNPSTLPSDVGIATYRIVQEALSNAIKHANATQVRVQLRVDAEHRHVAISITDDGQGLEMTRLQRGRGMTGMRERAQALGGSLQVDSSPGAGTAVTAQLSW